MEKMLKTKALVLRARSFNETDQILTLYTEKVGKISAIVKGVKKPKSKLRGGVLVFSHTDLVLYLGANLATVTQAETINTFSPLREDLNRMGYAAYLAELLDAFTPLGERDGHIFHLALMGNYMLSIEDPWLVARVMEIKLLHQLGYQPQLEHCVNCGQQLENTTDGFLFAYLLGGIICSNCDTDIKTTSFKINGETLGILKRFLTTDLTKINRLRISSKARMEIESTLDSHITNNLGRKLKSKEFLHTLA